MAAIHDGEIPDWKPTAHCQQLCKDCDLLNDSASDVRRRRECLESGDEIKKFLVDNFLTLTVEIKPECLLPFLDIFLGELHGAQAGGMFCRTGFGACLGDRGEEMLMNQGGGVLRTWLSWFGSQCEDRRYS